MKLREIQERMFRAITEPLTHSERTRAHGLDGRSMRKEAEAIIKPNDRLTSLERLEIYNRQYWFRILGSLYDDFPGLLAILGEKRFEKLCQAYIQACPSRSHTLRDLGARLESWLERNPEHAGKSLQLALDMVRLEWANTESFDAAERPPVTADELLGLGQDPSGLKLRLQPYLKIIAVSYPVDDIRIAVKDGVTWTPSASNAVQSNRGKTIKHSFAGLKPEPIHIAVHRQSNTIYYKRIDPEGHRMLAAIGRGRSLLQAVQIAFKGSSIPKVDRPDYVRDSFANWMALGWFYAS